MAGVFCPTGNQYVGPDPKDVESPNQSVLSTIKNKQRRRALYLKMKIERAKERKEAKRLKENERKTLGNNAPPKQIPKTIDNQRVPDDTFVDLEDEEVMEDIQNDEMSSYFSGESTPNVVITTNRDPCRLTRHYCAALRDLIPKSKIVPRNCLSLKKKLIPMCIERGLTDIVVVNESNKKPDALMICHLPNGPTARFKLSSIKFQRGIQNSRSSTEHYPELILNNFNTRLGHTIGRIFASLFPQKPEFLGRQVVTIHNQRDFMFFRRHRYIFRKEGEKVTIQELGPRFSLKLLSLQKGTFDSKFGEYAWVFKRRVMEDTRRRFSL